MPGRLSSGVLAGRAAELAELEAALERCHSGTPGVVLVGGEAGVGKTRLVSEVASRACAADVRVLTGQCAGLQDAAIPLLPIADALEAVADTAMPAELARVTHGFEARALPVAETVAPARFFADVLEVLRRIAESSPVLLAIEDVHWADRSTLQLLSFVTARLADERLLVIVTYRSDEIDSCGVLREFVAEATRRPIVRRLELARLTRAEVPVQLEGILGTTPSRRFADAVFARSDGNPLFTEELAVANNGADALPATLRDMLLARVDALSPQAQDVVRATAACGLRVHHRLLAAAAGLDEPALTAAAREAVRHHVIVTDDEALTFRHPLLQEAAYGELLPGERARLHRACATAIEDRPELAGGNAATVAAEVAHHWLRAGDRPRALGAAVRAGAEAERVHALAEAALHFCRALELWDGVPHAEAVAGMDRAELLARAAEATAWSGAPAHAIEVVDAAIALVDVGREAARAGLLHERRGFYLWWDNRGDEGVADYETAVRLVPAKPPSGERARVLAGLGFILMLAGRHAESRARCAEAISVARSAGARVAEVRALATLGVDLSYLGDHARGIAALRQARAMAREAGDPDVLAHTAAGLTDVLRRAGRLEEAIAVGLEGAADCHHAGLDLAQGSFCALNAAEAAFELGRWDLVERVTDEVLAREPTGMSLLFAHDTRGVLETARGDFDAAAAHLVAARKLADPEFGSQCDAMLCHVEAEFALWRGDPDAGWRKADAATRLAVSDANLPEYPELAALSARAAADRAERARARHRDPAAACEQARSLRTTVHAIDHPAVLATVEAEIARAEARPTPPLWEAAVRAWEARHAPYRAAYARWRQAEALLAARGGKAAAAATLGPARTTAARLGAEPLLREIDALARRARIALTAEEPGSPQAEPPVMPEAAHELGLTPRELEVLEHLALGQTNREIAGELFITPRTAGLHVSHILHKLDASTRTEAAAAAHRLGLVP